MHSLAADVVAAGQLDPAETERFASAIHDAARQDLFSMSLTAFAVVATAPTPHIATNLWRTTDEGPPPNATTRT